MTRPRALVVDDEPAIRELLEITLTRMDIETTSAGTLAEAGDCLDAGHWDLCLTDMRLPDGDGIDLVRRLGNGPGSTPVAVITAYGSMDTAIEALKAGAFDFVTKPVDVGDLRRLVEQALRVDAAGEAEPERGLVGESAAIVDLERRIAKVARSQAPVAITGESGTGKERVARLIHERGPRAEAPFVPVNCGAIPRELMESEFFGHVRGAFTGAVADKDGLFASAQGGTLFLDEIADLPLDMQVKLLRVIQEKRLRPVGATREVDIDVRLLSASHTELERAVAEGRFRHDLYYRINVIALHVPPLRERREDIPVLTDAIAGRLAAGYDRPPPRITAAAHERLAAHDYPGNVRELENILERALAMADGDPLDLDDLQLPPAPVPAAQPTTTTAADTADAGDDPGTGRPASFEAAIDQQQRQILVDTLERTRWNRTVAARELGLTYRQLRYRLKKLGID